MGVLRLGLSSANDTCPIAGRRCFPGNNRMRFFPPSGRKKKIDPPFCSAVGVGGLEPPTPASQTQCATNCATPRRAEYNAPDLHRQAKMDSYTVDRPFLRSGERGFHRGSALVGGAGARAGRPDPRTGMRQRPGAPASGAGRPRRDGGGEISPRCSPSPGTGSRCSRRSPAGSPCSRTTSRASGSAKTFPLILLPFNTFAHMIDPADVHAALKTISLHLCPRRAGGVRPAQPDPDLRGSAGIARPRTDLPRRSPRRHRAAIFQPAHGPRRPARLHHLDLRRDRPGRQGDPHHGADDPAVFLPQRA